MFKIKKITILENSIKYCKLLEKLTPDSEKFRKKSLNIHISELKQFLKEIKILEEKKKSIKCPKCNSKEVIRININYKLCLTCNHAIPSPV